MAKFEPWSGASGVGPEEARLSRLFSAVEEPEPLNDVARERVRRRLERPARRRSAVVVLRLVTVGAVLGVAGAAAAHWTARQWLVSREAAAAPSASLAPQPALPRKPAGGPRVSPSLPASAAEITPTPPSVAPRSSVAPAPTSRLGLEAASLERGIKALRGKDAARALGLLERHLAEFPAGALRLEARVARLDALLLLGRREEARRELMTLPLNEVGRKQELRLVRAELEAERDCRRAIADFDALLGEGRALPSGWAERALFGRGACLLKLGDEPRAERDFALYLERFPSGRFAEQLRSRRKVP
jgi:hypothetical protein